VEDVCGTITTCYLYLKSQKSLQKIALFITVNVSIITVNIDRTVKLFQGLLSTASSMPKSAMHITH